jgi:predicted ATP-grasp superfamily ATP-dependent carboligase
VASVPDAADNPAAFVTALGEFAVRHEIDLVLPGSERDLVALVAHRSRFPSTVRLAVPSDPAALEKATDKFLLAGIAADAGFSSPRSVIIDRRTPAPPDPPTPWVIKPQRSETRMPDGTIAHGNTRCARSRSELRKSVDSLPGDRFLLQPQIDGRLCAIGGVADRGELVCAEQRVAHRIWPPGCGQMAYAESVPLDASVCRAFAYVARVLAWTGIIQLQFIDSPEGRYLIDINPRIYASLALARAAGLNLSAIWAQLELGGRPSVGRYRPGARFRSELLDSRAVVSAWRRQGIRGFLRNVRPRARTSHAIFALRDPLPLAAAAATASAALHAELRSGGRR